VNYSASREEAAQILGKHIQWALARGKNMVQIDVYRTPEETTVAVVRALLADITTPTPIYHATSSSGPEDTALFTLGDFCAWLAASGFYTFPSCRW